MREARSFALPSSHDEMSENMIKATILLALVLAVVVSTRPVKAQETGRALEPDGPLARAITRESVRLGLAPEGGSVDVEWSRVRRLEPVREITVTLRSSQAVERYFVSADDSGLTVLNLTDPALPAEAGRALREMASQHREYLEGAAKGGTFLLDNLRLASDGVFVADRKVADLQHVVETNARKEVAEIRIRQKGRGVWGHLGPLGGYFVGAMSGGAVAGFTCQATLGRDRCDSGAFLIGALMGGIAGGVYGFLAANRETEDVIYRAP
jgi:hypothetical protein